MIWKRVVTLESLNMLGKGTLIGQLGMQFVSLTEDELQAIMPVDTRTCQPQGLLHGGASVALAETLGSVAGWLCVEEGYQVVGVEINASHLRAVRSGYVRGVCRVLRAGRRFQVWQVDIFDAEGNPCCCSRLTTAVVKAR